jgi:hypothetical protein
MKLLRAQRKLARSSDVTAINKAQAAIARQQSALARKQLNIPAAQVEALVAHGFAVRKEKDAAKLRKRLAKTEAKIQQALENGLPGEDRERLALGKERQLSKREETVHDENAAAPPSEQNNDHSLAQHNAIRTAKEANTANGCEGAAAASSLPRRDPKLPQQLAKAVAKLNKAVAKAAAAAVTYPDRVHKHQSKWAAKIAKKRKALDVILRLNGVSPEEQERLVALGNERLSAEKERRQAKWKVQGEGTRAQGASDAPLNDDDQDSDSD